MIKHLLSILFATTRQQFKYIIIIWFLDSINVCTFGLSNTLETPSTLRGRKATVCVRSFCDVTGLNLCSEAPKYDIYINRCVLIC